MPERNIFFVYRYETSNPQTHAKSQSRRHATLATIYRLGGEPIMDTALVVRRDRLDPDGHYPATEPTPRRRG